MLHSLQGTAGDGLQYGRLRSPAAPSILEGSIVFHKDFLGWLCNVPFSSPGYFLYDLLWLQGDSSSELRCSQASLLTIPPWLW
jgi:hypothetical protein